MYGTTAMYGTDHSDIFREQVKNNCMVHSIPYMYRWISYPLYSKYCCKYNISILQVRHGDECDITYYVKIVVVIRDPTEYFNRTQPAKATEYGNSPCTWNAHITRTQEPGILSGWRS
jgi:hypothetical protein